MKYTIEESIGLAATKVAEEIEATCIISITKAQEELKEIYDNYLKVKVTLFKKEGDSYIKHEYSTKLSRPKLGSVTPIKRLLMGAISRGYISKGDRVVCIQDESINSGYKGLLFVFDVDKIFFNISSHKLAENINSEVIESVIDIALELSEEGREGKNVGTAFIIGNKDNISKYTKQMIINPFVGHDENLRKVTDPQIKETIKEFSQLDGVFVIENNGTILSAGTYIDIDTKDVTLPHGLGTKHRNCAALTKETDAIAVVVSESGGIVRIFKKGQVIMKLP